MKGVRVRFAPSPTGYLHIGGARTALFNWLFARKNNGSFILRIEDTDAVRSEERFTKDIIEGLKWLGLNWDEGPFFQSKRLDIYRKAAEKLLIEGKAYKCTCSQELLEAKRELALKMGKPPRYDRTCRRKSDNPAGSYAIRFKMPEDGEIVVDDLIKGKVVFKNSELEDLVLLRSDGTPTYNLCAVVDDFEMGVTHIIRGDDHLNNTPKQMHIYQALSKSSPKFAHVPLILGQDRSRLSKRHGAVALNSYKEQGYLPEGMINFLVRLGWAYGDDEIFSVDELIKKFSLEGIGNAGAVFSIDKLNWINSQHIRMLTLEELYNRVEPFLKKIGVEARKENGFLDLLGEVRIRATRLDEIADMSAFYFREDVKYDEKGVRDFFDEDGKNAIKSVMELIRNMKDFNKKEIEDGFKKISKEFNLKIVKIAQAVRLALTGRLVSPGIFEVMTFLGKDRVIKRLERAISEIKNV